MNISSTQNVFASRLLQLGRGLRAILTVAIVTFALLITGCTDSSNSSTNAGTSGSSQAANDAGSSDALQLGGTGDSVNTAIQDSTDSLPGILVDGLAETAPIVFEPASIDLGQMLPRELVSTKFTIRNQGSRPITIKTVRPACACTKLDNYAGVVIPAGGSIELEARVKSRTIPSSFTSAISFLFDEYIGQSTINMIGDITMPIRTAPQYFNCVPDRVTGVGVESGLIVVESLDGKPFNILAADGSEPVYQDFDPDFDEPQSSYILEWDVSHYNDTNRPGWWVIETDHPDCAVIDVWVRHPNTPRPPSGIWRVRTQHVVVGGIKPGETADFEVDVQQRNGRINTITAVRSLSKDFSAKLVTFLPVGKIPPDSTVKVRITPTKGFEGLMYGEMQFMGAGITQNIIVIGKALENTEKGE